MTHLSLFSGIGGLDLAAEWAGFETVGQCECADYPTKVLEKHWPHVPRWRDINELSAREFQRRTGRKSVTLISGGFPCQPHSIAGKRQASGDERDLWPDFRRVIGEIKPRWVVAENVRGLLSSEDGRFFREILRDLASLGFDAGWATFPAAAVGAIHRRERVAIIAFAKSARLERANATRETCAPRQYLQRPWHNWWTNQPGIHRAVYGVPHRMDRIKALGNAVVPQQFYPIFAAITAMDELKD